MNRSPSALLAALLLLFVAGCKPPAAPNGPPATSDRSASDASSPGQAPAGYAHDKWGTMPRDTVRTFIAYTSSFDGKDDDDGDGKNDLRGQPEWVAYQIDKYPGELGKAPPRPSWFTDDKLSSQGIAPAKNTYHKSGYDRGHFCMKYHAWRLGKQADHDTHTLINASPMLHSFNARIWLDMEQLTAKWADTYGRVWIICGPVFSSKRPKLIGDPGEMKIPVPDAFYKIVVREEKGKPIVLALVYPHREIAKVDGKYRHTDYLTSVDEIEKLTRLDFLTVLEDDEENALEAVQPDTIWKR